MDPLIAFLTEILAEEILWPIAGAGLINLGRHWFTRRRIATPSNLPSAPANSSIAPVIPSAPLDISPKPTLLKPSDRAYRLARIDALAQTQRTWLIWTGGVGVSLYTALTPIVPGNFDNTKIALLILLSGVFLTAVVRSSLAAGLGAFLRLELNLEQQLNPDSGTETKPRE